MKKLPKFKDMKKSEKILRILSYVLLFGIIVVCIIGAIIYSVKGDPNHRLASCFSMMAFCLAPVLVELIFRFRVPNVLFLGFEIYLIIAGVWGSTFNGYNDFSWLDIVVHTIMGYLGSMLGIFVISKFLQYKTLKPWAVVLICFCFSMSIELIWEIGEWFSDIFLSQTAQGPNVELPDGTIIKTVTDTMEDIFCNFCGALVFCAHFLVGKKTKRSLGINTMEHELAGELSAGFIKKQQIIVEAPIMLNENVVTVVNEKIEIDANAKKIKNNIKKRTKK